MTRISRLYSSHDLATPLRLLTASALALLLLLSSGGQANITRAASPANVAGTPNSPTDSIAVTSPNNTTVAQSDDYATQVIADPWDMSNPEDTDYLDHLTPPNWSNGIWSAQSTAQYSAIFFQYQGWGNSIDYQSEANGNNFPIDSHRFTHFRVRMYSSVADQMILYWYRTRTWTPGGNSNFIPVQPGWHVYDIDLTAGGGAATGNWTAANWNGLAFDPVFGMGHTGANIQIDWARLTPPTSPAVTINWSASGTNTVSLYLDTDTNASNGTDYLIAQGLNPSSGGYTWNNSGLAAGTYYIRAVMGNNVASAYSGPLFVNEAPVLNIMAPSTSSGEDYATTVLGSPWALTNRNQVQNYYNIVNSSFGPNGMQGSGGSDPQIWFLQSDNAHAIDTSKYHYFNYNMYLPAPSGGVVNGQYPQWNAGPRAIWSPAALNWQISQVVIQWYNRTMRVGTDLRTIPLEPGSNIGWNGAFPTFRFDPHEEQGFLGSGIYPPYFRLGQVRLTADPTVANGGATTISWVPLKNAGTVTLSYSSTRTGPRTTIGTAPMSAGGYVWHVSGLPNGNYWITASSNDGLNSFSQTSVVPLKVAGSHPCPSTFIDVPSGSTFYYYISNLYCRAIVDGYSDNTFRPNYDATRAELAKWVVLARGWALDVTGQPHFTDVPPTDPMFPYIETAYNHGVISGYSDGTFRPYNSVTRGQMSKMIVTAMGWPINTAGGPHFSDVPTSNPFYLFIETIYNKGTVSGYSDGTFRWGNNTTRGQLSKVLWNSMQAP